MICKQCGAGAGTRSYCSDACRQKAWRTRHGIGSGRPRDLREEAEHLPESIDDLIELRARVMAAGESRRTADGLCMWVLAKGNGEPDTTASTTRAEYRAILRRLSELEPAGPSGGRNGRRARGDGGRGELILAGAAATGAAMGLATAATTGNLLLAAIALVAPVIPEEESYVEPAVELVDELPLAA